MKAYILRDRDNSRGAIEARHRTEETQMITKGVTLEKEIAQMWEESGDYREFKKVPVMEAKEEVTYSFEEKEGETFDDMFSR